MVWIYWPVLINYQITNLSGIQQVSFFGRQTITKQNKYTWKRIDALNGQRRLDPSDRAVHDLELVASVIKWKILLFERLSGSGVCFMKTIEYSYKQRNIHTIILDIQPLIFKRSAVQGEENKNKLYFIMRITYTLENHTYLKFYKIIIAWV